MFQLSDISGICITGLCCCERTEISLLVKHLCLSTWPCVSTDHNLQSGRPLLVGGRMGRGNKNINSF